MIGIPWQSSSVDVEAGSIGNEGHTWELICPTIPHFDAVVDH